MDSLRVGDLRIDVAAPGDQALLRFDWFGKSNDRQPDKVLRPYFAAALDQAVEHARRLELHFEQIEHFNSSTIMSVIQLIQEARDRTVRLVIWFDPRLRWQKLSFDALRIFDQDDGLFELCPVSPA